MNEEDSDCTNKNREMDSNKKLLGSEDSLTFSMTPPVLQENKSNNDNSDESISEQLTLNSGGTENDRSFQEIEISYQPSMLLNLNSPDEVVDNLSQEKSITLEPNYSDNSGNSDEKEHSLNVQDKSLNIEDSSRVHGVLDEIETNYSDHSGDEEDILGLTNIETRSITSEGPNRAHSILEEILSNSQFQSNQNLSVDNSKEESFNIFGNVDLDDNALTSYKHELTVNEENLYASDFQLPLLTDRHNLEKRMRDFEELIAVKDSTITALTSELDAVREGSHTNTGSTLSTTEYKQLQEECHNKMLEYNTEIIYKNELIQKLSESLNQSVMERKDLLEQIDNFKEEVTKLQEQLQETTKMVVNHECMPSDVVDKFANLKLTELSEASKGNSLGAGDCLQRKYYIGNEYLSLEKTLTDPQKQIFEELKQKLNDYIETSIKDTENKFKDDIENIKEKARQEKDEYDVEITRLRDLLANLKCGSTEIMDLKNELETKHSREMEALRTYFEKRCTQMEKNYSDEVFSQHSRKLSGSTCSDAELNSDMCSHPPIPDADIIYDLQPNITKKDIVNLQNEMQSLLDKISKFTLENITDEEFNKLKSEISKSNLNNLLKYDLSVIRNDLQNKFHAELELLREDYENKCDELRIKYENNMQELHAKYQEEVEIMKMQLEEMQKQNMSLCSAVQEVGSSGEFEINEVIQSYERRLQEQVTLAKIDFISALENQIQRLVANESDEEDWPSELLQLRDRFTEKYEKEIQELKKQHHNEIEKLKDEHSRVLNNALERARRRSLRDSDKTEIEILRERDNLKKQLSCQRFLIGELLKYYTQCEDELNNTLVEELLKQSFDKNLTGTEDSDLNNSSLSSGGKAGDKGVTRIHLTPNFNEIISLIDNNCKEECDSKDISIDLQNELGVCLTKLKYEANAILAMTANMSKRNGTNNNDGSKNRTSIEDKINSLTRQIITETQAKEKLKEELDEMTNYISSLEKEKNDVEARLQQVIEKDNILESELAEAKSKISELIENGHRETVSEGYGDGSGSHKQGECMTLLRDLQDKARSIMAQSRASADPTLLHLIEELCRVGERIKEESTRENQDLLQQIEVADKKYRTTQKFLDDQANEREQERDEAQKKIDMLYGQLRERDKDKVNCERVNSEVEQLEQQVVQMTKTLDEETQKCKDLESERNEAVDKIKLLRDIIRDLEVKYDVKSKEVNNLVEKIQKLEFIIDEQERSVNDVGQNESSKDISDLNGLYRHIEHLEGELQQLRVNAELAGSDGATLQLKKQLFELEQQIDRRTKDLEILHSSENTNCSSPSEDISARDVVRLNITTMDECEVPLQQLARLKEKLIRHSRAEDAAVKRIKDLEMHIFALKTEIEEASNEKDYMKKQLQEQLVLISDLQIRLDEQRIRAEHIEKQTNTSLEMKIYDMTNEITMLRDKLHNKDKLYNQQQSLLAETQQRLRSLEQDLNSGKDDEIIVGMQKELETLRKENAEMKAKIEKEAQIVPTLVENIISDKNLDIEKLKQKLEETEKQLEVYSQLNLDVKDLQTLSNLKSGGNSLTEIFTLLDLSQAEQVRRSVSVNSECFGTPVLQPMQKNQPEDTVLEPELSAISPALVHSIPHPRNSTTVSQKKVHFEDTKIENLRSEIAALEEKLENKDEIIKTYEERLLLLNSLENKIEKLQFSLEETEKALTSATETFQREQQELIDKEKDLGVQLAEKKLTIEVQGKEIDMLKEDSDRKDEMCLNLAKEKRELEDALVAVKKEHFDNVDSILKVKNKEIGDIQKQLSLKSREGSSSIEEINLLQKEIQSWSNQYNRLLEANKNLEERLKETRKENEQFSKDIQNKMVHIESVTTELNSVREKLNKKRKHLRDNEDNIDRQKRSITVLEAEVKKLKDIVTDRECEIEIANEDAKRYQNDIAALEYEVKTLKKSDIDALNKQIKEKDTKISELIKEKTQMTELINDKERIINQMAEDSRQLHVNLMTIKNKIKEPGNIIDLGNKLRDEQKKNAELLQEIHDLKAQLLKYKNNTVAASVEDITDQLKKELDYSAQIDSNIINAVSDHSLSSISDSHDVEFYKKIISREKTSKNQLLAQIQMLQNQNSELLMALQKEKRSLLQVQVDDAKLIEQLRIQLDTVLDSEDNLRKILNEKAEHVKQIEDELDSLKRKTTVSSASKTDSTEYKNYPSRSTRELNQVKKDYEIMRTEKNAMLNDYILLKQELFETEKALESAKQKVEMAVEKEKQLEEQIEVMTKKEMDLREELLQKKLRIDQLTDQLNQEKANFERQKQSLMDQIKSQSEVQASSAVPDELLNKIREINGALLDNRRLMGIIQRITDEKKSLENELDRFRKCDPEQVNYNQLTSWSQYLFSKTLKLESVRKALIWQKRYLADYVQSHEKHCSVQVFHDDRDYRRNLGVNLKPKQHFRAAVYAIISLHRMKYLVKRWHSGVRMSEKINMRHYKNMGVKTETSKNVTNFHVGQPVSSQLFSGVPAGAQPSKSTNPFVDNFLPEERPSTSRNDTLPWSGQTPPSREKTTNQRIRLGPNLYKKEEVTPLQAPQLLHQFVERFDQLQEKMGIVLDNNQT